MRTIITTCVLAVTTLVVTSSASALQNCSVKTDKKTGVIQVSAVSLTGTPLWGYAGDTVASTFFNAATCTSAGKLVKCNLADPGTDASRTPPAGCTLYLNDAGADGVCAAFVPGCTPKVRNTDANGAALIDQQRAQAGGVTAGDTPGFPVTISAAGSYRLTSNLDVSGEASPQNVTAVAITADNVTLDLNGFAILGPVTGCPTACSPNGGSGSGISSSNDRIKVINGSVSGMGSYGVHLGDDAIVETVKIHGCAGYGISLSNNGVVSKCTVTSNGDATDGKAGVAAWQTAVIRDNTISDNAGSGIEVGNAVIRDNSLWSNGLAAGSGAGVYCSYCTVAGNTATENQDDGISCVYCDVENNTASLNGGRGIACGSGACTIRGNSTYGNGQEGISCSKGVVIGNTLTVNKSSGTSDLYVDSLSSYGQNTLLGVPNAVIAGGGENIGGNLCNGALCP
ncbi:MAG: right-handed parallel beta-helix repeat-containing protein [Deltaproteobacteria bacterium]|nr:right-handed parallel beta-helix repeat-containing protein [Deltaproteobacteria bacterium]